MNWALFFGARSSAGIYDDLAKVVKELALIRSHIDPRLVQQHLDDVVAVTSEGDNKIYQFDAEYQEVSNAIGVSLASRDDPEKSFEPTSVGKILGVMYDFKNWLWWIDDKKWVELTLMMAKVRDRKAVSNGHMKSLMGKVNHMMCTIEGGPWKRGFLLALCDHNGEAQYEVEVTSLAKIQAGWWVVNLRAAREHTLIMDPRNMMRYDRVKSWCDAAVGAKDKIKNGACDVLSSGHW